MLLADKHTITGCPSSGRQLAQPLSFFLCYLPILGIFTALKSLREEACLQWLKGSTAEWGLFPQENRSWGSDKAGCSDNSGSWTKPVGDMGFALLSHLANLGHSSPIVSLSQMSQRGDGKRWTSPSTYHFTFPTALLSPTVSRGQGPQLGKYCRADSQLNLRTV